MNGKQPIINIPDDNNDDDEYYVTPIIPVIPGGVVHNDMGFCYDMRHECNENTDSTQELQQAHQDGRVSDADRTRIYQGRTF